MKHLAPFLTDNGHWSIFCTAHNALCTVLESHLDPFGCVAIFLDAAFRNVFNNGIVVATCTDVAALCGTCPAPALRNYGARIARTDFVKEMAARVVLSAMARFVVILFVSCLA